MRSNYKRLGNYIREVKEKNTPIRTTNLMGVNIDKYFMPSVANIVGTDLSAYSIVRRNQFACNRMHVGRDYRLPIALSNTDDEFIVSPAYDVFEIIDTDELLPEYLMMWFSRKEFDRNAWFFTDADVRGGLPWKSLCDMQLPIPDPDTQREIVREYNTIVNRIKLNEQLCAKLEETAQAIYKQWFVEFEFPDENGQPYKSSGGDMEYCKELEMEVPNGWPVKTLDSIIKIKHGYAFSGDEIITTENENVLLSPGNFKIGGGFKGDTFKYYIGTIPKEYILNNGDLIVTMTDLSVATDTLGYSAIVPKINGKNLLHNQRLGKIEQVVDYPVKHFVYWLMRTASYRQFIVGGATGTTVKHTSPSRILMYEFLSCPDTVLLSVFEERATIIQRRIEQTLVENQTLSALRDVLLSKLAIIENHVYQE